METISNNPNAVMVEDYDLLQKNLFKYQSATETKDCLSRIFMDILGSEFCDDYKYRQEIISTFETCFRMVATISDKHDPSGNDTLSLTITYIDS
jgi:hypothetical protein